MLSREGVATAAVAGAVGALGQREAQLSWPSPLTPLQSVGGVGD
jgi:hypothetical protein